MAQDFDVCLAGAKTCFKHVTSLTVAEALRKDKSLLPAEFQEGVFCENYDFRCGASARTWLRSHAQDNLMYDHPAVITHALWSLHIILAFVTLPNPKLLCTLPVT